jgi:hypothetical protein
MSDTLNTVRKSFEHNDKNVADIDSDHVKSLETSLYETRFEKVKLIVCGGVAELYPRIRHLTDKLRAALLAGNQPLINACVKEQKSGDDCVNWNRVIKDACYVDHPIYKYILKNSAQDDKKTLKRFGSCGACEGGHLDLVKKLDSDLSKCVYSAFYGGHPNIIAHINQSGVMPDNVCLNNAISGACAGGNFKIIADFIKTDANMRNAAKFSCMSDKFTGEVIDKTELQMIGMLGDLSSKLNRPMLIQMIKNLSSRRNMGGIFTFKKYFNLDDEAQQSNFWEAVSIGAIRGDHIDLVKKALNEDKKRDNCHSAMDEACREGCLEAVKLLIKRVNDPCGFIITAAQNGHFNIIQYILSNTAKTHSGCLLGGLQQAIYMDDYESAEIVYDAYALHRTDNMFESTVSYCTFSMFLKFVGKWKQDKTKILWDSCMFGGCESGNLDIVTYCISEAANKYNEGLAIACRTGDINIADLMIEIGATECPQCGNICRHE